MRERIRRVKVEIRGRFRALTRFGRREGIKGFFYKFKEYFAVFLRKLRRDRYEKELFHSAMILKNLALVYEDNPLSTDFIIEELMKGSRYLSSVYGEMLSLYRVGRDEEAFCLLYERVPLKTAKGFAMILSKLDRINPSELATYMDAFEKGLSEERMTVGMRRADKKSFIVTIFATVSVFAALLNFTVVVVFMKAMDMLETVFY